MLSIIFEISTRCVQLIFTSNYIYFDSDSPDETNYLYRIEKKSGNKEILQRVGNPVFYGCKVGESLFFSTVCEPSNINTSRYAVIWRSDDGESWYEFKKFKKDIWSMKYFQYGQILFPYGPGDNKNLWCKPFTTHNDQAVLKFKIE